MNMPEESERNEDTVVEQTIHVRTDLLAPGTDWKLYVTQVNTREVFDYSSVGTSEERAFHHVVPGVSHC